MNKTSVKIGGKNYIIDLDKAIEIGLCEEERIIKVNAGDVWVSDNNPVLIGECIADSDSPNRFQIFGLDDGLSAYSDIHQGELASEEEVTEWLKENEYEFVRNINAQICTLMEDAKSSIRRSKKS